MPTLIDQRVKSARKGENPTVICSVSSGWIVLGDVQFLRGYSLLLPDPVVPDLNALSENKRKQFLFEMSVLGDALLEVTDAYRINYSILGNSEPALHAHVFPRFVSEPKELKIGPAWAYFQKSGLDLVPFDDNRDKDLMQRIKKAVIKRL
jgi:diadenosine tetraphosphate (Ap4A) HIT family hydrolase